MPLIERYEKHVSEREKGTTSSGCKQNKWVEKREQYKPNIHLYCIYL